MRGETHGTGCRPAGPDRRRTENTLLDAKIDKIFEPTRDEVLLTLRTRTDTFKLLLSARSGSARICLTKETFENPQTPPSFCMLLRKHLTGGRLTALEVEPGDRLVFLRFCAPTRWATWWRTCWPWS